MDGERTAELWSKADPPNYITNTDKKHPYSEVPYLGEYDLVKVPIAPNTLIYHVDYWGEGKISTDDGSSGFLDCYNVNHPDKLVSKGLDRGRKIPNRIPIESHTKCNTSSYIKDNSVIVVTVTGGSINNSCAADIARMVHNVVGKVFVYGFDSSSEDIVNIASALENKALYHCPGYKLPSELDGLTLFNNHLAFLNVTILKYELFKLIETNAYETSVVISKSLNNEKTGEILRYVVQKLFDVRSFNIMEYAYSLWTSGAQDIVSKYFPASFKLIFSQEIVTIVNNEYLQAIELDEKIDGNGNRFGWASSYDKNSPRVSWKLYPEWTKDRVTFKLYNIDCDMYLTFSGNADSMGDRRVWGTKSSDSDGHKFYLEPLMKSNGTVVYYIVNYQYNQGLKIPYVADSSGNRKLWSHNRKTEWAQRVYSFEERFRWIISSV